VQLSACYVVEYADKNATFQEPEQQMISFSAAEHVQGDTQEQTTCGGEVSSPQGKEKRRVKLSLVDPSTSSRLPHLVDTSTAVPAWQQHKDGSAPFNTRGKVTKAYSFSFPVTIFCLAVYAAVRKLFDDRKRSADQCICGLHYNNQVAEIAKEMGLYNDPELVDKITSIVSSNTNCVSLEEMYVSALTQQAHTPVKHLLTISYIF
jgi:hypothetical protein